MSTRVFHLFAADRQMLVAAAMDADAHGSRPMRFVITLVIFMLLEREELRGRVFGLVGHGHLAVTTKALDEAGARVSRHLLICRHS